MSGVRRVDGHIAWLAAIALVAVAYTGMAFGMEWETAAGRIGPGFFPRIIGGLLVALCCVAIARRARAPAEAEPEASRHARVVVLTALAALGYLVLFELLGAVLASVVFMLVVLSLLSPGRPVANAVVAVLLPAALFLLFEVGLGAGLPPGPLPVP